jgi:IS30 family transposase
MADWLAALPSTMSRELKGNKAKQRYRATQAQK